MIHNKMNISVPNDEADDEQEIDIIERFNNKMIDLLSKDGISPLSKYRIWNNNVFEKWSEGDAVNKLPVNKREFDHILGLIKNDAVFTNENCVPQVPIKLQLEVVLYKLGSCSEEASIGNCATFFNLDDGGTQQIITNRVIAAILNLKNKYIRWPDINERSTLVEKNVNELPGCIGHIGRMDFKLTKDEIENQEYVQQYKQIQISMLAVCDYKLRIRKAIVKYDSNATTAEIFAECPLATLSHEYFSKSQWITGDSTYPESINLLTMSATGSSDMPEKSRATFNEYLYKYHVRIEKCFKNLETRFRSLTELIFKPNTEKSKEGCEDWIIACCILYNILIDFHDKENSEMCDT